MSTFKVLVTDFTWDSTKLESAVLSEVDAELIHAATGAEEELLRLVPEADAILTCFAHVTPEVVRAGKKLAVIGRYGIGVDNIAVDEATRLGIPVTNVPAYCLDEVAEHVFGMIFCLARGIHRYDRAVHDDDWSLGVFTPVIRIAGRTLGVVGLGKIGRVVAERAGGLGMNVVVHDPHLQTHSEFECVSLRELAVRSDFVTVHVPATPETEGMVNEKFFSAMRPGAYLINAARGAVVDQNALVAALDTRQLAGAALDVFVPERLPSGHPLLSLPNVIATPHVAFYSEESVADLATLAARNVAEVLAGKRAESTVNSEVYEHLGRVST